MKIRYIILEENIRLQNELSQILELNQSFECLEVFLSILDAAEFIENEAVDVVFMNCNLGDPALSGDAFYMCNYWTQRYPELMICLYGDNEEKAYLSNRVGSVDFFTVPFELLEIQSVITKIQSKYKLLQYKSQAKNRLIMIKTKNGYKLIERDRILFVERINRKNRMVTSDGNEVWLANYSMDELEKLLLECGFYRCYQSYIVNLEKVSEIYVNSEKKIYTLKFLHYNGEIILSREKYGEILELLKEQYAKVSL